MIGGVRRWPRIADDDGERVVTAESEDGEEIAVRGDLDDEGDHEVGTCNQVVQGAFRDVCDVAPAGL
jgi:hypothetical protein